MIIAKWPNHCIILAHKYMLFTCKKIFFNLSIAFKQFHCHDVIITRTCCSVKCACIFIVIPVLLLWHCTMLFAISYKCVLHNIHKCWNVLCDFWTNYYCCAYSMHTVPITSFQSVKRFLAQIPLLLFWHTCTRMQTQFLQKCLCWC